MSIFFCVCGKLNIGDSMRLQLIFVSLIWGLNIVVMKMLLMSVPPYHLAVLRIFLACVVIYILAKYQKVSLSVSKKQFPSLLKIGLLNVSLNFGLSFYGLRLLDGNQVAFLNTLSPLIMCIMTRQRPPSWGSLILSMIGFLASIHFDLRVFQIGHLFLFLSLVSYQLSLVNIHRLSLHHLPLSFWSMLMGGGILLGPAYFFEGPAFSSLLLLSVSQWLWFLVFSVLGFAIIQLIYAKATQNINMVEVSFYMNLAPVFTYLGSLLFLRETFDPLMGVGMLLIVVSLLWSKKSAQRAFLS